MDKKSEALRLAQVAPYLEGGERSQWMMDAAAELRRLHHNNEVLMNALWKACGDDEQVVNATIESQGEMR
jgi:hypothetical protein